MRRIGPGASFSASGGLPGGVAQRAPSAQMALGQQAHECPQCGGRFFYGVEPVKTVTYCSIRCLLEKLRRATDG